MKKALIIGTALVVVGAIITIVLVRPAPDILTMTDAVPQADAPAAQAENIQTDTVPVPGTQTTTSSQDEPIVAIQAGRYEVYDEALVNDNYQTTVLFFYAAWCPECRSFDQAITNGTVPDGAQILRVNYDDSQDLRQKYGVTLQSTFVRVSAAGDKQTLWNGYGKDKSVDAIIQNTK